MCWAGCTATRDRGARPQESPNLYHPTTDRSARRQDDTAPSVSAAQPSGPRSTYCISPHDFGRKHAARCIGHRNALHQSSQRAASANAPHCAPRGNSRKGFAQYHERKRGAHRKKTGKGAFWLAKCLFIIIKLQCGSCKNIERVLKGTFFSIFLFKCKTSEKQLFVTLWRKMPVWPLMSQGCAEAV